MKTTSSTPAGEQPARWGGITPWQWIMAAAVAVLMLPLSLPTHVGNDEGIWAYIGGIWATHGLAPYIHAVENKTPGILMLHALSNLLFGTSQIPLRLLGIVTIAAGSLAVAAIARRIAGPPAPLLAQTVFALTMGWHLLDGRYTAQTETFMAVATAFSLLFLIRACEVTDGQATRQLVLSGALLGVAITFKQVAVCAIGGWLAYHALNATPRLAPRKIVSGAALLAAGLAAVTLLSLVPLVASGVSVYDYWDGAWGILFDSSSSRVFWLDPDEIGQGTGSGLAAHKDDFIETWTGTRIRYFFPFLLLLAVRPDFLRHRVFLGLLVWGLFDFVGTNASGFYFGHQLKQVVPVFAIVVAVLVAGSLERLREKGRPLVRADAVLVLAAIVLCFPGEELERGFERWRLGARDDARELAQILALRSYESDYIYVADTQGSAALAHTGRRAPGRYFNTVFLSRSGAIEETLRDLIERPPAFIVKRATWGSVPHDLKRHIKDNYQGAFRYRKYSVLKLKR